MDLILPALILLVQIVLLPLIAPLLFGMVKKVSALLRGESGPPIGQPYFDLRKLFAKEDRFPEGTSALSARLPLVLFSVALTLGFGIPVFSLAIPEVSEGFGVPLAAIGEAGSIVFLLFLLTILRGLLIADSAVRGETALGRTVFAELFSAAVLFLSLLSLSLIVQSGNVFEMVPAVGELPYVVSLPLLLTFSAFAVAVFGERSGALVSDGQEESRRYGRLSGKRLAFVRLAGMIELSALTFLFMNLLFPFGLTTDITVLAIVWGLVTMVLKLVLAAVFLSLLGYRFAKIGSDRRLRLIIAAGFVALGSFVVFLAIYA